MALKDEFPSIEAGFSFVLPSYTWLLSRIEAADNRLNQVITLATTITSAVPALAQTVRPSITFGSGYFVIAVLLFVMGALVATGARLRGAVALPDPGFLYERLDEGVEDFQVNAIYFAGEHYRQNAALARAKSQAAVVATVCLTVEVVALIFWMALG
jgi:hypothetical protein